MRMKDTLFSEDVDESVAISGDLQVSYTIKIQSEYLPTKTQKGSGLGHTGSRKCAGESDNWKQGGS